MVTMTVSEMIASARGQVEELSPDALSKELERGDVLLVDIRMDDEVRRDGQIRGAVFAPRGMIEFWADPTSPYHRPEFDPNRRIVLYCASGGRSALASQTLQLMGYENVAHLDGGIKAWKESGMGLEHAR